MINLHSNIVSFFDQGLRPSMSRAFQNSRTYEFNRMSTTTTTTNGRKATMANILNIRHRGICSGAGRTRDRVRRSKRFPYLLLLIIQNHFIDLRQSIVGLSYDCIILTAINVFVWYFFYYCLSSSLNLPIRRIYGLSKWCWHWCSHISNGEICIAW